MIRRRGENFLREGESRAEVEGQGRVISFLRYAVFSNIMRRFLLFGCML